MNLPTTPLRDLSGMLTAAERWQVVCLALLAIAGAVAEALSIGAVFPFIALISNPDAVLQQPAAIWLMQRIGSPGVDRLVLMAACALLVLFFVKNTFLAALYAYQSRFVCNVEARLGIALLSSYLRAPFTDRLSRNSADQIRIVTGEVGRVTVGVMLSLIALFSEGLVVLALAILLLLAEPLIASVALAVIGAVALLMQTVFQRKLAVHRAMRVKTLSGMFRWVNEGIGAIREIKVLAREEHVIGEFSRNSRTYAHGTYVFTTLNLLPRLVFETAAVSALLLAVIASMFAGKPLHGIVPALTVFGLAAVRLLPSASRISAALNTLRYYVPAVEAVARDLDSAQPPAHADGEDAADQRDAFSSLELSNVAYSYPGAHRPSLIGIGLRIERGQAIAVLGRSGSGKTTLADLLLGLLEPDQGEIRVNGNPVHSLRHECRGIAGLVPQDIYLIDDTVRRNVALGLPDERIDDDQVWRVLGMAQLEKRVRGFPLGLDTPVGERGATMSGGERQRLGIARALYTDPQILVLDEATSALDEATQADFAKVLQALRGTKTILAITHRLRSALWCDRALVMSEGRIVADGPLASVSDHAAMAIPDQTEDDGRSGETQHQAIR